MDDFNTRIDRLTERHEALAQSLELMQHEINEIKELMSAMKEGIGLLFSSTQNLLETARIHESRLGRLEGGD